ncbi:MAG: M1 family metallopeptidase, partial [Ignavibacteria bacterium]|nr:M1 family metallopeptidase [Ignavibacteria bacterium]
MKSLLLFLIIADSFLISQPLYIPLEYLAAYEEGTRSPDGKPGPNYWQNKADYKITAELDPLSGKLYGSAVIIYYNNSPDVLDRIVFRLYQNFFKSSTPKDFPFRNEEFTEGIEINSLVINNIYYNISSDTSVEITGTNMVVKGLNIKPGKQAVINVSWNFEIPSERKIRMGRYDSTTFFIAYWYPQIAVYDDIDGWDIIEYTGQAEFYNDFNDYDVRIKVPEGYGVWATGNLMNAPEVMNDAIYKRYVEAQQSDEVLNIIKKEDYDFPKSPFRSTGGYQTWRFIASYVPDFSFGAAKYYLWDGTSVQVDKNRRVFVNSAYNPASLDFYEVCAVAAKTVKLLSHELPGVPFPYPKITVFNGGGGMETPMMVNQSSNYERIWMVYVTVHEVVHTYFPFYMGINERKYAWMDEGMTQMLSEYIQYEIDKSIDFRARNVMRYLNYSGQFDEVPMMFSSNVRMGEMYGNHAYFRPCVAYNIMREFLGEDQFKKALQEYIKRWNGKHPTPVSYTHL